MKQTMLKMKNPRLYKVLEVLSNCFLGFALTLLIYTIMIVGIKLMFSHHVIH